MEDLVTCVCIMYSGYLNISEYKSTQFHAAKKTIPKRKKEMVISGNHRLIKI